MITLMLCATLTTTWWEAIHKINQSANQSLRLSRSPEKMLALMRICESSKYTIVVWIERILFLTYLCQSVRCFLSSLKSFEKLFEIELMTNGRKATITELMFLRLSIYCHCDRPYCHFKVAGRLVTVTVSLETLHNISASPWTHNTRQSLKINMSSECEH